ncbi:MAG TPA: AraC family transcriptional regulator [Thermoanaerobaculia bacterium]|nr:AraC family transcriptional regulator [Thermoanaerobaculia bacterium]
MTEACIPGESRLPPHSHELPFFCLLVEGGYREEYVSRSVSYAPYTLAFHPAGETHACEMGSAGARVFNVEVPLEGTARAGGGDSHPWVDVRGGEVTWLATRLFREYRDGLGGAPLAAEALVLEMLTLVGGSAAREESARPRWLSLAVDYLESEFRRSPRLTEVAREVGTHPAHLSRVFRRQIGIPIGDYVHRLRVRYAAERISRSGARLVDVAVDAGFADQSHMTRVFKRVTGFTPGDFRTGSGLHLPH